METAAEYTSGGADSSQSAPAAEQTTTTTDAGAVTPESQPAADESGATVETETTEQESAESATEEKKGHNKTLEERAEEIADRKIQQRLAEAEQRRQAENTAQPDFVPIDYNAYDNYIAKLITAERQIQEELALDPEDPVILVRQLRRVQQERAKLENSFQQNEQKRQAWEQRNQLSVQQQVIFQQTQAEIDRTVAQIPATRGIDPEALEAGRKYISDAFQKDPTLQRRFDEIITHKTMYQGFSGVQAAVDWAIGYAQENMGKAADAARQKRESGKELNPGAAGSTGGGVFSNIQTFNDLMKLPSAQINQFAKQHPQRFENLKTKHFK